MRRRAAALFLTIGIVAGCSTSSSAPAGGGSDAGGASGPTDVPFDVEALTLPLPDGGAQPDGVRFAINLQIGSAAPVRAFLDTGSSGILVAPNAPQAVLDALTSTARGTYSGTFGSGITATGVLGSAPITLGNLTTASPIQIALIQRLSGGVGAGVALQQLFNGYSAIVGIGMRNYSASLGNPIAQFPGHPSYIVEAPAFGETTGTLRIHPSPGELASYETLRLASAPAPYGNLAGGIPAWSDNDVAACIKDSSLAAPGSLCAGAILDTGNPGAYVLWPGYSGPSLLPPGSEVDVSIGSAAGFSVTVGANPQPGLDAFSVSSSTTSHISLGTLVFFRFDVYFDQVGGIIGLSSHTGQTATVDAGQPCDVTYDCGVGQTCWTPDGSTWSCVPAGSGAVGSSCNPSTSAGVTCGERMTCLGSGNPPTGTCRYWCDASNPCPAGAGTCTTVHTTKGATLHFCI